MNNIIKKFFSVLLCIGILGTNSVFAENIYPSYTYTRTDSGKLFYDIAVGTNTSVAVGRNGRIYYDDDGEWKETMSCSFDDYFSVNFTGAEFVAVGEKTVISSPDGQSWQSISENGDILNDGAVIYSNGVFIVEKADGIYTTADFRDYDKISSASSKINKYQQTQNLKPSTDTTPEENNVKYYYDMIFGNNIADTRTFDKNFALFINLSGINTNLLPTKPENIEYIEVSDNLINIYYIKEFTLIKAATNDFKTWSETVIDLPNQNEHLTGVAMGKTNMGYVLAYDTNDTSGIYKMKKYVISTDLTMFEELAYSDVRGDFYAENGKIFVLTAVELYKIENGTAVEIVSSQNNLTEKAAIIDTDRYSFMWKRDNGIKLYWNKTGEWTEITDADTFITSHYIDGNANYQILWIGDRYIIRPTDYDNGYNPTGAKGEIHIYDENFSYVKTVNLDRYVLQMSFAGGNCYVLLDNDTVMFSRDFEEWSVSENNEFPLTNGKTQVYKTLTKADKGYDYTHKIKSISNQNIKKEILFENWKGSKVDVESGSYLRYDDTTVSISDDGVYWKDISLPIGIDKVKQVRVDDSAITVVASDVELRYSIGGMEENTVKTYVEIDNKILGFDTPPVTESDRTLVPLRFIFETLGADVDWDGGTQTATVTENNTSIRFSIDNVNASVDGKTKTMDVPARLINDKTLVPLRFLSEELGFNVDWDETNRLVTISK